MSNNKITNVLLMLAVAVFLFGSGYQTGKYASTKALTGSSESFLTAVAGNKSNPSNVDFTLFWDVWNKLQEKYVDKKKISPQKMVYGAIKGMVASVEDPYTFFLSPDENKEAKNDLGGKFQGIGAQLGLKDNRIVVIAPLKSSPAEKAGIKSGDYINKVDDASTKAWTLNQAVYKIRGEKGTKVKLTLERNHKEYTVSIVRDEIHVSSVDLSTEVKKDCSQSCGKVARLKLNQFGDNTNDEWDKAVAQIQQDYASGKIKGMVLDLRDNPGGYLDSAVYTASEFLPMNKLVVKQESTTSESKSYYVFRDGKLKDIPLVVLINKGSASASEILSGALRDYKRAKLIGEKSFGKGSVQEALDLKNGAGLHVTVAKWILPNGDWINGKGIEPDVKVQNELKDGETLSRDTDAQLDAAVQELVK